MPKAPLHMRIGGAGAQFLAGWGFPSFLLFTAILWTLLLMIMLVLPTEGTAMERFAEDFRIWCFGYDPETGSTQWAYAATIISAPFLLGGFTVLLWWEPLRELLASAPGKLWRTGAGAVVLVACLAAGMGVLGMAEEAGAAAEGYPFPADSLRVDQPAPELDLIDHHGQPVTLERLQGRLVIVTGIYAQCALACPLILGQAKRVLEGLPPGVRRDVVVVGITMDPEHDRPEVLADLAAKHGVDAPAFLLATGSPPHVERVLDRYDIARQRNPDTGVIDHANLFLVIDRNGRLAYRFSLGERQAGWLGEALELLAREPLPDA
jgi:protein SCO1